PTITHTDTPTPPPPPQPPLHPPPRPLHPPGPPRRPSPTPPPAQGALPPPDLAYALDNLWVLLAGILVVLMQAGFALLEAGFNAAKNAVNIFFKNTIDLSIGVLLFFLLGFGLMYGTSFDGLIGTSGFGLVGVDQPIGGIAPMIFFFFQAAFAATATTICAGSVAGRMGFLNYMLTSAVITGVIYPISGHWVWGGGWLSELGFHDFAGSLVVHAVGGFAGLAGALVLGPRLGQFGYTGGLLDLSRLDKAHLLPHNLPLAGLGMLILWIGWYGFNAGSELAIYGRDHVDSIALIVLNTTLAASAGAVTTTVATRLMYQKPELSMTLNGTIGGLVGITACCDGISPQDAIIVGAVAGLLVIFGVVFLIRIKIDDTVGAWAVHGLCGIWGGVAYGLFSPDGNLLVQIIGSLAISGWAFLTTLTFFWLIHKTIGLRVPENSELVGLDTFSHGERAYRQDLVGETR
ncbi:MAG: ammonium transporter, partial [Candidatus Competibacterales bacterium]